MYGQYPGARLRLHHRSGWHGRRVVVALLFVHGPDERDLYGSRPITQHEPYQGWHHELRKAAENNASSVMTAWPQLAHLP